MTDLGLSPRKHGSMKPHSKRITYKKRTSNEVLFCLSYNDTDLVTFEVYKNFRNK